MYENNGLLIIFLRLNGITKIKNAKLKCYVFGPKSQKFQNRRKYLLYGIVEVMINCLEYKNVILLAVLSLMQTHQDEYPHAKQDGHDSCYIHNAYTVVHKNKSLWCNKSF